MGRFAKVVAVLGVIIVVLAVAAVIAVIVMAVQLNRPVTIPTYRAPVVKMPSPNGYDYFLRAAKQLKSPDQIDKLSPGINATDKFTPSTEQVNIVEVNGAALKTLREGLKHDYLYPPRGFDATYVEGSQYRRMARLLVMEGLAKAAKSDWDGAMSSYQDALLLGETVPRGAQLIGSLVGIACQTIGRYNAWDTVPHLSSEQAEKAAHRMLDMERRRVSAADAMECEERLNLQWLQLAFAGKEHDAKDLAGLRPYTKARIFERYQTYMDQAVTAMRQPYASRPVMPELTQSRNPFTFLDDKMADIWLEILCSPTSTSWCADVRGLAENRLLTLALALQSYRVGKGRYPERLDQLSPSYLLSLPSDPFAISGTFHYRLQGESYVLWSVGPDGIDDNGKPAINRQAKKHASAYERHFIQSDSKGDMVAFINR